MKTTKTFENASLVSVMNGSVVVKSAAGIEHTFTNASVVSINNSTIIIELEWEPKKGELVKIITIDNGIRYAIFKDIDGFQFWMYCSSLDTLTYLPSDYTTAKWYCMDSISNISPVTPEEQQAFDDFCKSQGKIWNKEKLQWEEYRWKPQYGDYYYRIAFDLGKWVILKLWWADLIVDINSWQEGNCFQTKEEAEIATKKIKELFKSL